MSYGKQVQCSTPQERTQSMAKLKTQLKSFPKKTHPHSVGLFIEDLVRRSLEGEDWQSRALRSFTCEATALRVLELVQSPFLEGVVKAELFLSLAQMIHVCPSLIPVLVEYGGLRLVHEQLSAMQHKEEQSSHKDMSRADEQLSDGLAFVLSMLPPPPRYKDFLPLGILEDNLTYTQSLLGDGGGEASPRESRHDSPSCPHPSGTSRTCDGAMVVSCMYLLERATS